MGQKVHGPIVGRGQVTAEVNKSAATDVEFGGGWNKAGLEAISTSYDLRACVG